MFRLTTAATAFSCTAFWMSDGSATTTTRVREPSPSSALVTNCYKMAERIVPRMRGRSAWVIRHADHCVRSGGGLL
jgi:hypothetical protein